MNSSAYRSHTRGLVFTLFATLHFLAVPGAAIAGGQLVIGQLTFPSSVSPGQIVTGEVVISNPGDRDVQLSSLNVQPSDFSGNSSASVSSLKVTSGGVRIVPFSLTWYYYASQGTKTLQVSAAGYQLPGFSPFIQAIQANFPAKTNVGPPVVNLVMTSADPTLSSTAVNQNITIRAGLRADLAPAAAGLSFSSLSYVVDAFFLRAANAPANATDPFLGTYYAYPVVGQTYPYTATFPIPAALAEGRYNVVGRADYYSYLTESNETDNLLVGGTITLTQSQIDLALDSVSAGPLTTSAGATLSVSYTGRFIARAQVSTPSPQVRFYLSPTPTLDPFTSSIDSDSPSISPLGPGFGNVKTLRIPSYLQAGRYFLIAQIDPTSSSSPFGSIHEFDETNNTLASGQAIQIQTNPADIVLLSVTPSVAQTSAGSIVPLTYLVGYTAPDTTFLPAGVYVGYGLSRDVTPSADDFSFNASDYLSISPRSTRAGTASLRVPSTLAPGTYFPTVNVDVYNYFTETNKANNKKAAMTGVDILASPLNLALRSVTPMVNATSVVGTIPLTYDGIFTVNRAGDFQNPFPGINFYLSRNGQFHPSDVLLSSDQVYIVNGAFSRAPTNPLRSSSVLDVPPGDYFVVGVVDPPTVAAPAGAIGETSEVDNVRASSFPVHIFRPRDDHPERPNELAPEEFRYAVAPRDVLSSGTPVSGKIDFPGDIDFFLVQATEGVPLQISCIHDTSIAVTLLDQDGIRTIRTLSSYGAGTFNLASIPMLRPGTYYLKVEGSSRSDLPGYTIAATSVRLDLRPTRLDTQPAASLSESLPITLSAAMDTAMTGVAPVTVSAAFYLSTDRVLHRALDLKIGTASATITTNTPGLFTTSIFLKGVSGLKAGVYNLIAEVDSDSQVQETNENNNVIVAPGTVTIGDPNLDVQIVDFRFPQAPSSVGPESLVRTTYAVTVAVQGSTSNTFFHVNNLFYLSRDNRLDSSDVQLSLLVHGYQYSSDMTYLGPRQVAGNQVDLIIPPSTAPGSYFVLMQTNSGGEVVESNTANKVAAIPLTVGTSSLDVGLLNVQALKGTLSTNDTLPVSVSVQYTATASPVLPLSVSVQGFLSRDPQGQIGVVPLTNGTFSTVAISPNTAQPIQGSFRIPPGTATGSFFLTCRIAPSGAVAETSLANNVLGDPNAITLTGPTLDAKIVDFTAAYTSTSVLGTVPLTITVRLDDTAPASAGGSDQYFDVRVSLSPTPVLPPGGASYTVTTSRFMPRNQPYSINLTVSIYEYLSIKNPGNYFMILQLDPSNKYAESDKSNNTRVLPLTVTTPQADFYFTNVQLLAPVASIGDSVIMSASAYYDAPNRDYQSEYVGVKGYLSLDGVLQRLSDPKIAQTSTLLYPQQPKTEIFNLPIPSTIRPGNYFVIGELDPDNAYPEKREDNNVGVSSNQVFVGSPQTNFSLFSFQATKSSVVPAEALPITATLFYDAPSVGYPEQRSVNLEAFLSPDAKFDGGSDRSLGQITVELHPGERKEVAIRGFIPNNIPAGNYFVLGVLDKNNALPDSDRTDNVRVSAGLLTVGQPAVNLAITGLTFSPQSAPTIGSVTATASFSYTVPDPNQFDPLSFSAEFFLSNVPQLDKYGANYANTSRTVTIAPNGTATIQTQLNTYYYSPGTYFVGVAADRQGVLGETTLTDNLLFSPTPLTLTIAPPLPNVDLSVGPLAMPTATAIAGTAIAVPFSVLNNTLVGQVAPSAYFSLALSASGTTTPSSFNLGSRYVYSVPPGGLVTDTLNVFLSRFTAPGQYFLWGRVGDSSNPDPNPSNDVTVTAGRINVLAPTQDRPPVANAGPDLTVATGRSTALRGTGFDPDNDSVQFNWSQVGGPSTLAGLPTTNTNIRITSNVAGTYTLRFTVTESGLFNASTSDDVLVTFADPATLGPLVDTVVGPLAAVNTSAEGSAPTATLISGPDDVGLDRNGNLFYVECSLNRIRELDRLANTVSTIAGPAGAASSVTKTEASAGKTPPAYTSSIFTPGFSGDGGAATAAKFGFPRGVAATSSGALLIADTANHRIRQMTVGGTIDTIAGGADPGPFNTSGYSGDGGLARAAGLKNPEYAAQDPTSGDIFIADTGNHVVRRIHNGIISTVAGTGFPGTAGDDGPATRACLDSPARLAFDGSGSLFIADRGAHRIRKVDLVANTIKTSGGTGVAGFSGDGALAVQAQLFSPEGVGIDTSGIGYVCDRDNNRIRRVDRATKVVTTLGGSGISGNLGDGGPAPKAQLASPHGMAIDSQQKVYFCDATGRIRVIGASVAPAAQPPAVVMRATDQAGSFSFLNDTNPATTGVYEVAVTYVGLSSSFNGNSLQLFVTPQGSNIPQTVTGTVIAGNITFTGVNLTPGTVYTFTLADSSGKPLSSQNVSEGRDPVAVIKPLGGDGQGPQTLHVDGTASFDLDAGDRIKTFFWAPLFPLGPDAISDSDKTKAQFTFPANKSGRYAFRLTVTDTTGRTNSKEAQITIINVPPTADPGPPRQFLLPNPASNISSDRTTLTIALDGRASRDANGDPIRYQWRMVRRPQIPNSTPRTTSPVILDATAPVARIKFAPDRNSDGVVLDAGPYLFELTTSDPLLAFSRKTVEVRALDPRNVFPNANAGLDRAVVVTRSGNSIEPRLSDPLDPNTKVAFVRLDGRESADSPPPGGLPRPLTYKWTVTSSPAGSAITGTLINGEQPPRFALPTFVPDLPGIYAIGLVVSNGQFESTTDTVNIDVSVRGLNAPPTAEFRVRGPTPGRVSTVSSPVLTFAVGDLVTLDGTFSSDRDDPNQLTYEWTQTEGDSVALAPSTTDSQPSFTPTTAGLYTFELVAKDLKGARSKPFRGSALVLSTGDFVPALALAANAAGAPGPGKDFGDEVTEGTTSSLRTAVGTKVTISATVVDPDVTHGRQRLTYLFSQVSGPTVALTTGLANTSSLQSQCEFTPTTSRVHVFEGRVIELDVRGSPTGVEAHRFLRVVVDSTQNHVPAARALATGGKAEIGLCQSVSLVGSGSDSETATGSLQFRWTQVAGPQVVLSNPFSQVTTFVAPDLGSDEPRDLYFALVVDDGRDQSEPSVVSVRLDPTTTSPYTFTPRRGLDLISLPVLPRTTPAYTAEDLSRLTSSPVVIRAYQGTDGAMLFQAWAPNLGLTPFEIHGNEGYLISSSYQAGTPITSPPRPLPWSADGPTCSRRRRAAR
ncbi:MAG: hypothetical protein HY303_01800 [Candidatus Wallbacteria bacterium]|nr:hypothetical protein [Candidatus Wallbacteria bacterium]